VRSQELAMASSLIETMAGDFDPSDYKDAYREALQAVIEAKAEGREVVQPAPAEEEPAAADLLSALRASVEAAKKSRGGAAEPDGDTPAKDKSGGKDGGKDGAAKKAAAGKKTTAKKTPARSRKSA
jgi:DNA end-binding protein Ku